MHSGNQKIKRLEEINRLGSDHIDTLQERAAQARAAAELHRNKRAEAEEALEAQCASFETLLNAEAEKVAALQMERDGVLARLIAEEERRTAAEASKEKMKADYEARLETEEKAMDVLRQQRDEALVRIDTEVQRAAELEKKIEEDQASLESAIDAAKQAGADKATKEYNRQMGLVKEAGWRKGWRAALREARVPANHPAHRNIPKCPDSNPRGQPPPAA